MKHRDLLNNLEEFLNGTHPGKSDSDSDGLPDFWEIQRNFNPIDSQNADEDADSDGLTLFEEYSNETEYDNFDTDYDNLGDGWEVKNGLDPLDALDFDNDPDLDGLNNTYEYTLLTDPQDSDTDDDGIPDGWEFDHLIDPLVNDASDDPDNDTLSNLQEYQNNSEPTILTWDNDDTPNSWENSTGLNPHRDDSDFDYDLDGLNNSEEYLKGTHPKIPDTDNDQMTDGWESKYNLTPTDNSDANIDNDNDDLTNLQEFQNRTNPLRWDTDYDQIPDKFEVESGMNPFLSDYGEDYDEDGLSNGEEYSYKMPSTYDFDTDGVYEGGLDPTNPDTDGDGIRDGWEVANSYDALNNSLPVYGGDTDGDQLSNHLEYLLGTRADLADTDNDGISDYDECYPYYNQNISVNDYIESESSENIPHMQWRGKNVTHHWIGLDDGQYVTYNFSVSESSAYIIQARIRVGWDPNATIEIFDENNTLLSTRTHVIGQSGEVEYNSTATYLIEGTYKIKISCDSDNHLIGLFKQIEIIQLSSPGKPILRDWDGDGLLDGKTIWVHNGTGEIIPSFNATSGATHYFGELSKGTLIGSPDSDGDGLLDGFTTMFQGEYAVGELSVGTNPNNPDTDGDGLLDSEELELGLDGWITDPLDMDSDDDGLRDGWIEVDMCNQYHDGIDGIGEWHFRTNPNNNDTDRDGIEDGVDCTPKFDAIAQIKITPNGNDRKFRVTLSNTADPDTEVGFTSTELDSSDGPFYAFYNFVDEESITTVRFEGFDVTGEGDERIFNEETEYYNQQELQGVTLQYQETSGGSSTYSLSNEALEKIQTLLFTAKDNAPFYNAKYDKGPKDNEKRYTGDTGFYVFMLNVSLDMSANESKIIEGLNTWLVPSGTFYGSSFYEDFNNSVVDPSRTQYLKESTQFHNNTRSTNSSSIMALYSINITYSDALRLFWNLSTNSTKHNVFKAYDISDEIFDLGLPGNVIDIIPFEAPKLSTLGKIKEAPKKRGGLWGAVEAVGESVVNGVITFAEATGINEYAAQLGSALIGVGRFIYSVYIVGAINLMRDLGDILMEFATPETLFAAAQLVCDVVQAVVDAVLSALNWFIEFIMNMIEGTVTALIDKTGIQDLLTNFASNINNTITDGNIEMQTNGNIETDTKNDFNDQMNSIFIPAFVLFVGIYLLIWSLNIVSCGMSFIFSMAISLIITVLLTTVFSHSNNGNSMDLSVAFDNTCSIMVENAIDLLPNGNKADVVPSVICFIIYWFSAVFSLATFGPNAQLGTLASVFAFISWGFTLASLANGQLNVIAWVVALASAGIGVLALVLERGNIGAWVLALIGTGLGTGAVYWQWEDMTSE